MAPAGLALGAAAQPDRVGHHRFVIDRHPHWANAWIAGGGTGHAFKHGPVIGEYLARLAEDGEDADS